MPFKNRETYLEYQRRYYKRRKRNSNPAQELDIGKISNPGLTEGFNNNAANPKSAVQSLPQRQGVTSTVNPSVSKGLKTSIPPSPRSPLNPGKPTSHKATQEHVKRRSGNARPVTPTPVFSDQIWENTQKHVEELRRQGWEIDGLGNAHRIIKE
jgi:hypothetical protein